MKFAILIGLPTIALGIIAYHSMKVGEVTEKPGTMNRQVHTVPLKRSPSLRDSVVSFATDLLGTKYAEGACGKDGFDCSGFVYYVFRHFRIKVPRSSSEYKHFGKEVPIDSVQKGDVLVFLSPTRNVIGHVGIVVAPKGRKSDFIHASSGSQKKVIITNLGQKEYTRRFVKAVEVL